LNGVLFRFVPLTLPREAAKDAMNIKCLMKTAHGHPAGPADLFFTPLPHA
jgi:hypothetical protein